MSSSQEEAEFFASDVYSGGGEHTKRPRKWALLGIHLTDLTFDDFRRDENSGERNYYAAGKDIIPPSHIRFIRYFEAYK